MTYEADPAALEMLTRGEEWRPVADWEGLYEVSSFGRVKSLERVVKRATSRPYVKPERLLRPATKSDGHPFVGLHERERRRVRTVHILVARSFLGEPPPGTEVCHNDGDSRNNFIYNLRYDTRLANVADMFKHGRNHDAGRTNCKRGHPAMSACRACNRARWLLHQLGKKYGVRTDEAGFTALSWQLAEERAS